MSIITFPAPRVDAIAPAPFWHVTDVEAEAMIQADMTHAGNIVILCVALGIIGTVSLAMGWFVAAWAGTFPVIAFAAGWFACRCIGRRATSHRRANTKNSPKEN